ncbi:MAG: hypothetical protein DRQ46_08220 [Gammaproteobacteria bacterium]|nr:MAG: hypothetical protein DRQ46_08220 [Gammaproteobacteria bacterium]
MNDIIKFIIGRPIEGISLNGYEYLLDPDGHELLFDTVDEAKKLLSDNGVEGDELEDCYVYQKVKMVGKVLVAMEETE